MKSKKTLVHTEKKLGKYSTYNCTADRDTTKYRKYSWVILILNMESMCMIVTKDCSKFAFN
jgi:hypothetical protein